MKIKLLFLQSEHENIGIEYLSAALKDAGHEVKLLFIFKPIDGSTLKIFKLDKDVENKKIFKTIDNFKPDVVCFSPFTTQYLWSIEKAKFIKKNFPNVFNLFGGVHVNSVPEVVVKNIYVDGILVGEADKTIVEFADKFKSKKYFLMQSFWGRKDNKIIKNGVSLLPKNLNVLPFPDKELFYSQLPLNFFDSSYVVMGSRGCPFACTYCSNNVYQDLYRGQNRLRFRDPKNVIEELVEAKKKYNFKRIEFMDDVLTIDYIRLKELMNIYVKKVDLPFSCFLHPKFVTEKMIKMLRDSGCYWLKMGVQSANEKYRSKYLNRGESNEKIIEVAKLCNKYKLRFSLDHIFNLPGESKNDLIEAVNLYNECRPTIINSGSLIYLPKTKIIEYGLKEKIINKRDVEMINEGKDPISLSPNVNRFSLQSKHREDVNISAFSLLFILVTILPKSYINYLLKIKFYNISYNINLLVLIFFKVISKIKARQFYIYLSVLNGLVYFYEKRNEA
jgi:radical SAM superfamily enzyme YgiQ (UPF0313 family)